MKDDCRRTMCAATNDSVRKSVETLVKHIVEMISHIKPSDRKTVMERDVIHAAELIFE